MSNEITNGFYFLSYAVSFSISYSEHVTPFIMTKDVFERRSIPYVDWSCHHHLPARGWSHARAEAVQFPCAHSSWPGAGQWHPRASGRHSWPHFPAGTGIPHSAHCGWRSAAGNRDLGQTADPGGRPGGGEGRALVLGQRPEPQGATCLSWDLGKCLPVWHQFP